MILIYNYNKYRKKYMIIKKILTNSKLKLIIIKECKNTIIFQRRVINNKNLISRMNYHIVGNKRNKF